MPVEVGLGVNNAELKTGLEEARSLLEEFGEKTKETFSDLALGSVGIFASLEGVSSVIEYGSHLQMLHDRFAVSLEDLQKFGYAATQNGVELDTVAMAFNRLEVARSRALQGNKPDTEAFSNLGISIEQLRSASPEELMLAIGRSSMDAAEMVQILGRNALDLAPTLKGLADGSQEFGQVMGDDVVKSLDKASAAIADFKNSATVMTGDAISHMVPLLDMYKRLAFEVGFLSRQEHKGFIWQANPELDAAMKAYDQDQDDKDNPEKKRLEAPAPVDDTIGLQQKLTEIDAEATRKKLSAEEQIAALRLQQMNSETSLAGETDPDRRKEIEKEIIEDEKEIVRIQMDGARSEEDAAKRIADQRLRAEEQYQRLKEENAHRQMEIESTLGENATAEEKAQMAQRLADLQQNLANYKQQLVSYLAAPGEADQETLARMQKAVLDGQDEVRRIQSSIKADEPKRNEHETSLLPQGGIEAIGGRLSSADYGHGNLTATTDRKQMIEHLKNTADDVHWIKQQYQTGTNTATYAGDF